MRLPIRSLMSGALALLACEPAPGAKGSAGTAEARQILAGARRAMAVADGRPMVLATVAEVSGPRGTFRTLAVSARDGRARVAIGDGFLAGIGRSRAWMRRGDSGRIVALDSVSRTVLRGHELHMLALAPETRWHDPTSTGRQPWDGRPALAVGFRDDLAATATAYFSVEDTLPLGVRLVNHTGQGAPEVEATFTGWTEVDGVRLFREAEFRHGPDRYRYRYTSLRLDVAADSTFEPPP